MYRAINNMKTGVLMAAMMALFVVAGGYLGGRQGMIVALILGGGMNIVAYFYSDKLALAMMRAQPLDERHAPEIYHTVRGLSERAGLPMPRVYISPVPAPNAFATGRNPEHAVVCLTEGIVQQLDRRELAGVIAHELAHIKHRDVLISTVAATIAGAIGVLPYLLLFMPFGGRSRGGNPLAALAMIIIAPFAAALIQSAISRRREFNADNYAGQLVGDPMPLATALEKLQRANERCLTRLANPAQANLFIVEPFTGANVARLFATHPPVQARVEALIGRETTGRV